MNSLTAKVRNSFLFLSFRRLFFVINVPKSNTRDARRQLLDMICRDDGTYKKRKCAFSQKHTIFITKIQVYMFLSFYFLNCKLLLFSVIFFDAKIEINILLTKFWANNLNKNAWFFLRVSKNCRITAFFSTMYSFFQEKIIFRGRTGWWLFRAGSSARVSCSLDSAYRGPWPTAAGCRRRWTWAHGRPWAWWCTWFWCTCP